MKNLYCLVLVAIFYFGSLPATAASDVDETKMTEKKITKTNSKKEKEKTAEIIQYPLATRVAPEQKGTESLMKLRNQMILAFQKEKVSDAIASADKLKADEKSNNYDKSIAIQVKKTMLSKAEPENKEIIPLLEQLLELNSLDNNSHYNFMQELAQRYLFTQDYEDALATANKFMQETKIENEIVLTVSGNALYRLGQFPKAIANLEKVRALNPANATALQMLARAYSDAGQNAKAAEINKGISQNNGNDKESLLNLAINYRDTKELDKAGDVIDDLRKQKLMSEERDYLVAVNVYQAMKNREKDIVVLVEEGFANNALKPNAGIYNALAEAYYYSDLDDNVKKAMQNWTKAAPLSKDGAVYLNLAIVQCQEELWLACKESAKSAIAKGGINANDAKTQIANADKALGKSK